MPCRRLLSFVLLSVLCAAGCDTSDQVGSSGNSNSTPQQSLAAGKAQLSAASASFPFDFALTDVTGTPVSLADFQGKVVIVDFWGTWCPPCRTEIPFFIKLQTTYGSQGLQMIGLNYMESEDGDEAEARQKVIDFISENSINYPCALGTDDVRSQVPDFDGFPTTIFIDKSGQVRAKLVGLHKYEALEGIVQSLLSE